MAIDELTGHNITLKKLDAYWRNFDDIYASTESLSGKFT